MPIVIPLWIMEVFPTPFFLDMYFHFHVFFPLPECKYLEDKGFDLYICLPTMTKQHALYIFFKLWVHMF